MRDVIGPAATAGPFVHSALFYRSRQEFLAATTRFVRGGLSAGQPVAVAVPEPNLRLLRDRLDAAAADVRFIDMSHAGRNPGRIIPGVLRTFADAHPGTRVRIVGEPVWPGRSAAEYPACVQHEALINLAFDGRAATFLCPYDAAELGATALDDALATHPLLLDGDGYRGSDRYAPHRAAALYNQPLPDPPHDAATLTVNGERLAYSRNFTAHHARRLGLADERVQDAVLAVAELAANSVAHGGGSGTLRIWRADGYLICQVSDAGHIRDPLAGRGPQNPSLAGGHGLLVVNHVADLVRTHTGDGGTTTRVYLR